MKAVHRFERVDHAGLVESAGLKPAPRPGKARNDHKHCGGDDAEPGQRGSRQKRGETIALGGIRLPRIVICHRSIIQKRRRETLRLLGNLF
jgi:hypothetical protein